MPLKDPSVPEVSTLMTGLLFGESPGWRDGRFWVSDWVAHEVIAVDLKGKSEVVVREHSIPLCFDFLPDGRLVIMSGRARRTTGASARCSKGRRQHHVVSFMTSVSLIAV